MDKESLINNATTSSKSRVGLVTKLKQAHAETLAEFSIIRILCICMATGMLVTLTLTLFLWTSIGGE